MTRKIDDELLEAGTSSAFVRLRPAGARLFEADLARVVARAAGPSLKVVSTMSAGYDHVDVSALKKRNIRFGTSCVSLA